MSYSAKGMKYEKTITLKDGRKCILRNATAADADNLLKIFKSTHSETDFNRTYPDEMKMTIEKETQFLDSLEKSGNEIEIVSIVDGKIVGSAGIECISSKFKERHRADFGVNISKEYWGLGIGRAILNACIECARVGGYRQIELTVVGENDRAISLYKSVGFLEFGRNPLGFLSRNGNYQTVLSMRLELN